jgi:oligoribonuclease NrnB/cAMP/cGMP phosphodiesterase (DHH superfamily)
MSPLSIKTFSELLNTEQRISSIAVITHVDLDGMAAWIVVKRYHPLKAKIVRFSSYSKILSSLKTLKKLKNSKIFITDLFLRPSPELLKLLRQLKERGNEIYVIDHHSWKDYERELIESVVTRLMVDEKHCAAMNVYRFLREQGYPKDPCLERMLRIVEDVDLWRLRYRSLSLRWHIVSSSSRVPRDRIVSKLESCVLWDTELESYYRQEMRVINQFINNIINEISNYYIKVKSTKLLLVKLPRELQHQQTVIAELLRQKLRWKEIDVLAFVRDSGSVSLRLGTTSKRIDLSQVARKLGGGGHPGAAGASLGYNLLDKLRFRFTKKIPKIDRLIEAFS